MGEQLKTKMSIFISLRDELTLLEPQYRFGDKLRKFQVVRPQNGTAVLKGLSFILHQALQQRGDVQRLFLEAEGCTHAVHDCSRITVDLRMPTLLGRITSGFHQPGRHCLHQVRNHVRCLASCMRDGRAVDSSQEALVRRTFLHMDDIVDFLFFCSGVTTSRDSNEYTTLRT